ncbi:ABC transporter permease [Fusobacterium sp.]|uniref:ABC transporter permease n=1 Tax=Fusobacterium sp. TaxID=68766 RepID=UPI0028FEBAC6|nr:ABC transporter permease [Fusobacterium sp.]MDU1909919.1 ABC transporter permease [Fusobacterium sp.]
MKRILKFLHLKYLYLYFIIYFISSYFFNGKLKSTGIYLILGNYLGIIIFPVLFMLILSPLFFFIKDRKKKMIFNVKLHAFFILLISCLYLFITYKLELPFTKELADDNIIEKFLNLSIYKYKIGFIAAYLFYLILKNIMFCYIYSGLGFLIFCTFFLITAKFIKTTICRIYHEHKEKKRIQKEEQLLREQIAIKEALEKREADKKLKMELEKEIRIKERVEEVILNKELVLESYSIDENKNNDIINNIKEPDITEEDEEFLKIIDPDFFIKLKEEKPKEEISEQKEKKENPASDMAYENTIDFPLFTITDSSEKEKTFEEINDNTENLIENNLEKSIKKSKKERELLTIRSPGGKKDDSSF